MDIEGLLKFFFFSIGWPKDQRKLVKQDLRELKLVQERKESHKRAEELTKKLTGDLREANGLPRDWSPDIDLQLSGE